MNIFDQILASGYFVFEKELNSHIVRQFINLARRSGKKFSREELKMMDISRYMEFNNHLYSLKNGYTMGDIALFIDCDMVRVFQNLKSLRDTYYSSEKDLSKRLSLKK